MPSQTARARDGSLATADTARLLYRRKGGLSSGGAGAGGVALLRGDEPGAQSSAAAGTPQGSALSLGEDADPAASDPTWRFSERFEPFVF